jgi:hypothetical protein
MWWPERFSCEILRISFIFNNTIFSCAFKLLPGGIQGNLFLLLFSFANVNFMLSHTSTTQYNSFIFIILFYSEAIFACFSYYIYDDEQHLLNIKKGKLRRFVKEMRKLLQAFRRQEHVSGVQKNVKCIIVKTEKIPDKWAKNNNNNFKRSALLSLVYQAVACDK